MSLMSATVLVYESEQDARKRKEFKMAHTKRQDRRGGSVPNERRWGQVTVAELQAKIEQLKAHAATLEAVADSMAELGREEIRVDSVTKFDRANDLLMTYLAKLEMAVISAKYGQQ